MSIIDRFESVDHHRSDVAAPRATRTNDSLDLSIERQRMRGIAASESLSRGERGILEKLVANAYARAESYREATLEAACAPSGLFRLTRFQRWLDSLRAKGLVRYDRLTIRPTVAGMAALLGREGASSTDPTSEELMRTLRRAEIGTL